MEDPQKPSSISILIDSYRESRTEGYQLAQSFSKDITFILTLLTSIIGGGIIVDKKLLLIFPFVLCGFAVYVIQKFRFNNLITAHMIFLEELIDEQYNFPVLMWNKSIVRQKRNEKWGNLITVVGCLIGVIVYYFVCSVFYEQNKTFFSQNQDLGKLYIFGCIILFGFALVSLLGAVGISKKFSPDKIKELLKSEIEKYLK